MYNIMNENSFFIINIAVRSNKNMGGVLNLNARDLNNCTI